MSSCLITLANVASNFWSENKRLEWALKVRRRRDPRSSLFLAIGVSNKCEIKSQHAIWSRSMSKSSCWFSSIWLWILWFWSLSVLIYFECKLTANRGKNRKKGPTYKILIRRNNKVVVPSWITWSVNPWSHAVNKAEQYASTARTDRPRHRSCLI